MYLVLEYFLLQSCYLFLKQGGLLILINYELPSLIPFTHPLGLSLLKGFDENKLEALTPHAKRIHNFAAFSPTN